MQEGDDGDARGHLAARHGVEVEGRVCTFTIKAHHAMTNIHKAQIRVPEEPPQKRPNAAIIEWPTLRESSRSPAVVQKFNCKDEKKGTSRGPEASRNSSLRFCTMSDATPSQVSTISAEALSR